jgi:N-acetylmuramic acid 6-phosphate etherase
MVCSITDVSYEEAEVVLKETEFDVKLAIVMIFTNVDKSQAQQLIAQSGGFVREAVKLAEIKGG